MTNERMLNTNQKSKAKPQCDHFILVRKAIIKKTITSVGTDVEKVMLVPYWWEYK